MDTEDKTKIFKTFKAKNGQEILLREPRISDVKDWTELYNSITEENFALDDPYTYFSEKHTLTQMEAEVIEHLKNIKEKTAIHIVAEIGEKMVAVCSAFRGKEANKRGAKFAIIVHKDYRELGVGTTMFEMLIGESKKLGIELAILGFYETNKRAKALYQKFGFKEYGRLPNARLTKKGKVAAILMYKEL